MSNSLTSALLARLGFLVVEYLTEDSFQLIGSSPNWYKEFCGENFSWPQDFYLTQTFPFIEVFLFYAQEFWEQKSNDKLNSGPWTEADLNGKEYHLQATALLVDDKKIILIENISYNYQEKQALLQQLRENSLNHDQIVKKIRAEFATSNSLEQNTALIGGKLNERYQIELILGKGGLGIVYRAIDLETNTNVAVKMLLEDAGDISHTQKMFEREMKVLKRVKHPNVVGILDSGLTPTGRPFFIMDYVKGKSLSDLIEEERIWSVERTFNLLKYVCPALNAIHQEGIIHRDLKPANIMIKEENGEEIAVILDLGIAKIVAGGPKDSAITQLTKTGMIVGTIQYLAPEQCLGKLLDLRTDIYALGIIVYELLTGMLPYESDNVQGWLFEHLRTIPEPLSSYNPMISPEIDKVVLWALEKRPEDRPQTTLEFLDKFAEVIKK